MARFLMVVALVSGMVGCFPETVKYLEPPEPPVKPEVVKPLPPQNDPRIAELEKGLQTLGVGVSNLQDADKELRKQLAESENKRVASEQALVEQQKLSATRADELRKSLEALAALAAEVKQLKEKPVVAVVAPDELKTLRAELDQQRKDREALDKELSRQLKQVRDRQDDLFSNHSVGYQALEARLAKLEQRPSSTGGVSVWLVVIVALTLFVCFGFVWWFAVGVRDLAEDAKATAERGPTAVKKAEEAADRAAEALDDAKKVVAEVEVVGERITEGLTNAGASALLTMQDQQKRYIGALDVKATEIKDQASRLNKAGEDAERVVDAKAAELNVKLSKAIQQAQEKVDELAADLNKRQVLEEIDTAGKNVNTHLLETGQRLKEELEQLCNAHTAEIAAQVGIAEKFAKQAGEKVTSTASSGDSSAVIESIAARETAALANMGRATLTFVREIKEAAANEVDGVVRQVSAHAESAERSMLAAGVSAGAAQRAEVNARNLVSSVPAPASTDVVASAVSGNIKTWYEEIREMYRKLDMFTDNTIGSVTSDKNKVIKEMAERKRQIVKIVDRAVVLLKDLSDNGERRIEKLAASRLKEIEERGDVKLRLIRRAAGTA